MIVALLIAVAVVLVDLVLVLALRDDFDRATSTGVAGHDHEQGGP